MLLIFKTFSSSPLSFPMLLTAFPGTASRTQVLCRFKTWEHLWPVLEAFLLLQLNYFSLDPTNATLNNRCERHLPKQRTSRRTIKDRWNVLVRESTTEHNFPPRKSEQRTSLERQQSTGDKLWVTACQAMGRQSHGWRDPCLQQSHPGQGSGWVTSRSPSSFSPQWSVRWLLLHWDRFMHTCAIALCINPYISLHVNYPIQASVHSGEG